MSTTRADLAPMPTTVWRVWLDRAPLRPLQAAALRSCERDADFPTRLITNNDTARSEAALGFSLHPSFHLLDPVQAADYLRCELLHHYGGFYLDTDIFCLRSLRPAYDASHRFDASGATLRTEYARRGAGFVMENNAMGPFRPHTDYTTAWRTALWRKMDEATAKLKACAKQYPDGNGGIAYRQYLHAGKNKCGFDWGTFVGVKLKLDWGLEARGFFGRALQLCDGNGQLLGLASSNASRCDVMHVGTAASWKNPPSVQHLSESGLCKRYPVLSAALGCPVRQKT